MTAPLPDGRPSGRRAGGDDRGPDRERARALCRHLGALLAYPRQERFAADLAHAEGALLEAGRTGAARELEAFERAAAVRTFEELQDLYTRTFDLAPRCPPYLSIHLFGQESFDRSRLMTGLEATYERAGIDRAGEWGGELPDHVAVVLSSAHAFDDDEWDELVELGLARPLALMHGILRAKSNPYRHLLEAVRRVLGVEGVEAEPPAEPHWKKRRRAGHGGLPDPDPENPDGGPR